MTLHAKDCFCPFCEIDPPLPTAPGLAARAAPPSQGFTKHVLEG